MAAPESTTSLLTIRVLGPLDVRRDGVPLPRPRSRKSQWLLALLLLRHGRDVERSWLAGMLWPDRSASEGLALLRRELTDLRRVLGPEANRLGSPTLHTLRLDLSGAEVDLVAFDAAIGRGDTASLERAVSLYGGALLEGCEEEWIFEERQAREQAYLSALERMAAAAGARGEPGAAVEYLRKAVAVEPLRESAQRALMAALAAMGSYAAAGEVYRELRLLLYRELNAQPAPETAALYHQIRDEARCRATNDERRTTNDRPPARNALALTAPSSFVVRRSSFVGPESRLPQPLTALVGREQELREVEGYLANVRLVTLTGTGGVGKTRLAIRVAQEVADDYADGVWFVELAALSDPTLVPQAVASVLGVCEQPDLPMTATLQEFLRAHQLLLVLDNCEQVIETCAQLAETLLRRCAHLRILATSRQSLGLTGEVTWRVPSLSLPAPEQGSRVEGQGSMDDGGRHRPLTLDPRPSTLVQYEAVRLFVERAAAVAPGFTLTERNAAAVVQLCCRLDGIPLAIELAAARVKALPVEQIPALLDHPFRLLTGGSRAALPRHQTLRATIDWSYDLLPEAERSALRRLSVFAGGFPLEAAQAVCSGAQVFRCSGVQEGLVPGEQGLSPPERLNAQAPAPPGQPERPGIEEWEVLDLLAALVDKGLVVYEEPPPASRHPAHAPRGCGEVRYRLLETIRRYGGDRLEEAGETEIVRSRHRDWCLRLAEEASPKLNGPEQVAWLERLEREHDNLRAALEWSLTEQEGVEGALRLARAVEPFWRRRGYVGEGRMWIARALHAAGDRFPEARGAVLRCAAGLALLQNDHAAVRSDCEASLEICRATGDQRGMVTSLGLLGAVAEREGDLALARSLYEQCLALRQGIGSRAEIAHSLADLGTVALKEGDLPAARSLFESALAIEREMGRLAHVANALLSLGHVARSEGNSEQARACYEESLTLARRLGARAIVGYGVSDLGLLLVRQGQYAAARAALEEGLRIWPEVGNKAGMVRCLEGMGQLAWAQGEPHRAARLFGAAEALREALQFPLPPVDRADYDCVPAIAAALGDEAFAAAWAEGRAMTLEEAVREAVGCVMRDP